LWFFLVSSGGAGCVQVWHVEAVELSFVMPRCGLVGLGGLDAFGSVKLRSVELSCVLLS